jgi:hypothetical protein
MTMIRNAMFGLSLLALSAGSALAAPAKHVTSKPRVVAEASAPAGDTAAPAGDKADKKTKKAKKDKAPKGEKTEGTKEMKAPAPATK